MEKELLNKFRERDIWSFLGFFMSDDWLYFQFFVFSFLPKKIKIKEQRYRVRYTWLSEENERCYSKWNWYWEFKEIIK